MQPVDSTARNKNAEEGGEKADKKLKDKDKREVKQEDKNLNREVY